MQVFSNDEPERSDDDRLKKLRALRSSMADTSGPTKSREDLDRMLRSYIAEAGEAENSETDPVVEAQVEAVALESDDSDPVQEEMPEIEYDVADPESADDPALAFMAEPDDITYADETEADLEQDADEVSLVDEMPTDILQEVEELSETEVDEPPLDSEAELEEDAVYFEPDPEPVEEFEKVVSAEEPIEDTKPIPAFDAAALIAQLKKRAASEDSKDEVEAPESDDVVELVSAALDDEPSDLVDEISIEAQPDLEISEAPEPFTEATPEPEIEPQPEVTDEVEPLAAESSEDLTAADPEPSQAPSFDGPVSVPDMSSIPESTGAAASIPRRGRARQTRVLGFDANEAQHDPFAQKAEGTGKTLSFPVGWLVVIEGPGAGESFALGKGASQIGRGDDQPIRLDFGDETISRENHAAIAYDPSENQFFLTHGGKANIVRLNSRPVLSTETLSHGDHIRIGQTRLRFAAFCDETFAWDSENAGGQT